MKFKIHIKNEYSDWWETIDTEFPVGFGRSGLRYPTNNPEEYGRNVVAYYNETLRPGESPREYLGLEIIDQEE